MHESILNAFKNKTHELGNHPIYGEHGEKLIQESFKNIKEKYKSATGSDEFNPYQMMSQLNQLMRKEASKISELKELAIKIIKDLYGLKDNIKFEVKLGREAHESFTLSPHLRHHQDEDSDDEIFYPEEVNQRHTINGLIHGAAIHQMLTLHHKAEEELKKIDPSLVKIYDEQARGMVYSSWKMPLDPGMLGQQGGEVQIDYDDREKKYIVKAAGIIFPILLQELSKGVMEILSIHSIPKGDSAKAKRVRKEIYKHADKSDPDSERLHYIVGPAIWQKLIKIIPENELGKKLMCLFKKDPNKFHEIIEKIISTPENELKKLKGLF